MPRKAKIFFDTSVCIDVARGTVPAQEWNAIAQTIRRKYTYVISPLTGYELIAGLHTGQPEFFNQNREALRVLYPAGKKKVLPVLKVFVPFQLFGERRAPGPATPNLDLWIRMVLKSKDRASLESGQMKVGAGRRKLGLDLGNVNKQMRDIENGYATYFRRFVDAEVPDLTRELWVDFVLKEYDEEFRLNHRDLVAVRTDAAYHFSVTLWRLAKDPRYNIHRYKSELVDAQQLYYLCDENLVFLTSDSRLKNKILMSTQANRVLTLDEVRSGSVLP